MKDEELTAEELLAEIDRILGKEKTPKETFEADTPDYEELMKETDRVLSELHTQEPEQKETSKPVMELSFPVKENKPFVETNISETEKEPDKPERTKKHAGKWIGDIAFYLFLIVLVVSAALLKGGDSGAPKSLAGFSMFTVLTGSMQDEIPQGSLVITQQTDPRELKIGDDVTYLSSPTTTVTHRIVGIIENYNNTGQRAFETQGIMNAKPDEQPVPAGNVVGKVIFHSYALGRAFTVLSEHWLVFLMLLVLTVALIKTLKIVFGRSRSETNTQSSKKERKKEVL